MLVELEEAVGKCLCEKLETSFDEAQFEMTVIYCTQVWLLSR